MIVVADTGPIHYLILSGHIGLIHDLYRSSGEARADSTRAALQTRRRSGPNPYPRPP